MCINDIFSGKKEFIFLNSKKQLKNAISDLLSVFQEKSNDTLDSYHLGIIIGMIGCLNGLIEKQLFEFKKNNISFDKLKHEDIKMSKYIENQIHSFLGVYKNIKNECSWTKIPKINFGIVFKEYETELAAKEGKRKLLIEVKRKYGINTSTIARTSRFENTIIVYIFHYVLKNPNLKDPSLNQQIGELNESIFRIFLLVDIFRVIRMIDSMLPLEHVDLKISLKNNLLFTNADFSQVIDEYNKRDSYIIEKSYHSKLLEITVISDKKRKINYNTSSFFNILEKNDNHKIFEKKYSRQIKEFSDYLEILKTSLASFQERKNSLILFLKESDIIEEFGLKQDDKINRKWLKNIFLKKFGVFIEDQYITANWLILAGLQKLSVEIEEKFRKKGYEKKIGDIFEDVTEYSLLDAGYKIERNIEFKKENDIYIWGKKLKRPINGEIDIIAEKFGFTFLISCKYRIKRLTDHFYRKESKKIYEVNQIYSKEKKLVSYPILVTNLQKFDMKTFSTPVIPKKIIAREINEIIKEEKVKGDKIENI